MLFLQQPQLPATHNGYLTLFALGVVRYYNCPYLDGDTNFSALFVRARLDIEE